MEKEAEMLMNKYLIKVKRSLDNLTRNEIKARIEMIKAHISDAIEDQGGMLSEVEIVKNSIKELGIPTKDTSIKKMLMNYSGLLIGGIILMMVDIFLLYPIFGHSASISYFLIVITAEGGFALWKRFIIERILDKRFNIIYGWIFFPVLVLELWLLDTWSLLPMIEFLSIGRLVLMIYGILLIVFTVFFIIAPGEFLEKQCPNCNEHLPGNSKFCLKCGEELE